MRVLLIVGMLMAMISLSGGIAAAADESKVKAATDQVKTGAQKIGDGKIGQGIGETAKGIGKTVVEGSKFNLLRPPIRQLRVVWSARHVGPKSNGRAGRRRLD